MNTIEERLGLLEDEAAIRHLVARFADGSVTANYEEFLTVCAPNGKWTIHEPLFSTAEGPEAITEMMRQLRTGKAFFAQFVHSGVITLAGGKATARWVMREAAEVPGDSYYNNYAMYIDTLEKIDGKWLFVTRDYHYMWLDTGAFPGDVYSLPAPQV